MSGASKSDELESEFGKDLGLMHEAIITGRKAGWKREDWAKLAHDRTLLEAFLLVVRGEARVEVVTHTIDCDTRPFIPDGWEVHPEDQIASRFTGQFVWDPSAKIELYLDPGQQDGKAIKGNKLRTALEGQPLVSAQMLDFLLANPKLVPKEWKGKQVCFWGTIYRSSEDARLHVRCLYWDDTQWRWDDYWVGRGFDDQSPAASLRVLSFQLLEL